MSDKWICLDCEHLNNRADSHCSSCNTSYSRYGVDVTEIQNGREVIYAKHPTMRGSDEVVFGFWNPRRSLSKCPSCNMLMFTNDLACPHCCHILSSEEKLQQKVVNNFSVAFYLKSAIVSVLILLALYVFFSSGT